MNIFSICNTTCRIPPKTRKAEPKVADEKEAAGPAITEEKNGIAAEQEGEHQADLNNVLLDAKIKFLEDRLNTSEAYLHRKFAARLAEELKDDIPRQLKVSNPAPISYRLSHLKSLAEAIIILI